jgi:hypothetical protein
MQRQLESSNRKHGNTYGALVMTSNSQSPETSQQDLSHSPLLASDFSLFPS